MPISYNTATYLKSCFFLKDSAITLASNSSMSYVLMINQRPSSLKKLNKNTCKSIFITTAFIFLTYMFLSSQPYYQVQEKWSKADPNATNISHLVFGIAASSNTWNNKRFYIQSWWQPNTTRGFVFMDRSPIQHLPWPSNYPPFRVSDHNTALPAIRLFCMIEETVKAEKGGEVRWYVMGDDDTVFFMDNLVEVLSKYDHGKYFYVGMNSESIVSNGIHSFGMAFGGGGFALSYPLAKAVAHNMGVCMKRYSNLYGGDHILHSCLADMGVSLTQENGFHQIDLHKDISGFLSAHPHSPLVSLHHLDAVDPIFPSATRTESLTLLLQSASLDESRILQQSVCYYKKLNWTISAAWGYSVHIHDAVLPPSHLHRPLETFAQWKKGASPPYMFNARPLSEDPCQAPRVLFFEAAAGERVMLDHRVTSYVVRSPAGLAACRAARSVDNVSRIRVLSPLKKLDWQQDEGRRECCDVVEMVGMDSLALRLRDCGGDEIIA